MEIALSNIEKRFGPVRANDDVSLTVEAGSIHGLLGENGAGKSTLIRILGGLIRPDAGEIRLDGKPVELTSPARALEAGVGVLHQEPLDFPQLTVLESFLVGRAGPIFLARAKAARELRALAERFGFAIDPEQTVGRLSMGERQQIELLRLLSLGVRALLLDEPTTGISSAQQSALFGALKQLARDGHAVVLVSHKLADVDALCDRVSVLRQGKVAGHAPMPAKHERLVELMFGKALAASQADASEAGQEGEVSGPRARATGGEALALEDLAFGDHRLDLRLPRLHVRRGEVIGLAGLEGSGQRLFLEVCAGLLAPRRGRLRVAGAELTGRPHAAFLRAEVCYLPADRAREGLIAGLSIEEHVELRAPSKGLFLRPEAMRRAAERAIEAFRIRGQPTSLVEQLSGGNQQRTQLALLPPEVRVLLMEHPTRGLDVASARWVWEQMLARCGGGTAILFASSDLEELVRYSDRLLVFSGGGISAPIDVEGLDLERLGLLIGGQAAAAPARAERVA